VDWETWRFINTFADWLAALGTVGAVVVALYLARKGNRIELEVRAGLRKVAFVGVSRTPTVVPTP
jgi:ABC-type Fe3+ transport system permease subunit